MLVLADPASKVTQIFTNAQKARDAILTYGFFPISPTGRSLPVQEDSSGELFIDGQHLADYLLPQMDTEGLHPYVRPPLIFPSQSTIPYTPIGPYLSGLEASGGYRLFLFRPAGSPGCAETQDCFMTGHYDPSLTAGPCSAPDPHEFHTLSDLQTYAQSHGETLMEVQSDQEVQRVCGATPVELMNRYVTSAATLSSWLPYLGIGAAALLFLRKRRT